jgi:hypothetical protein
MKNGIIAIILILNTILCYSQNDVSKLYKYKYINVPLLKYSDGSYDKYNISSRLKDILIEKGFKIITDNEFKNNLPREVVQNPALILICEISHSGLFTQKVSYSFFNANKELVYTTYAESSDDMASIKRKAKRASRRAVKEIESNTFKFNYNIPKSNYSKNENNLLPFNLNLINDLSDISSNSVTDLMVNGYAFKLIDVKNSENGKNIYEFQRVQNDLVSNKLKVQVVFDKDKSNQIIFSLHRNYDINNIKIKLLNNDYDLLYTEKNKISDGISDEQKSMLEIFNIYKKDQRSILISKKPNDEGITFIIVYN